MNCPSVLQLLASQKLTRMRKNFLLVNYKSLISLSNAIFLWAEKLFLWRNKDIFYSAPPYCPSISNLPVGVLICWRLAKSPSLSPLSHISPTIFILHSSSTPTPSFPSSSSPSPPSSSLVMDYMSPLSLSCPQWIMEPKPRVDLRDGWELQQTEGKLQILGYCVLSSRYDVVSVSMGE